MKLLRVQLLPIEGHTAGGSVPMFANSILLPTPAITSQRKARGSSEPLTQPWIPSQSILNQTAWKEVVDEIWFSSDSSAGNWKTGHVTYSSPNPHAFVFEALPDVAHLQYRGYIAVDDITYSTGACQSQ